MPVGWAVPYRLHPESWIVDGCTGKVNLLGRHTVLDEQMIGGSSFPARSDARNPFSLASEGSPPSGENGTRARDGGARSDIESLAPSHGSDRGGVEVRCPLPATLQTDRQHGAQTAVGGVLEGGVGEDQEGDDLPQLKVMGQDLGGFNGMRKASIPSDSCMV